MKLPGNLALNRCYSFPPWSNPTKKLINFGSTSVLFELANLEDSLEFVELEVLEERLLRNGTHLRLVNVMSLTCIETQSVLQPTTATSDPNEKQAILLSLQPLSDSKFL
jgi:hypothetical protein